MAKYDKRTALKIMIEAAKKYEEKLKDKHFLIIYREGKDTKTTCVGFRDMNFLHMTGVKTRLSAQQFYAACLDSKLSVHDFEIDNKGKVQQKLMVLPYLASFYIIIVWLEISSIVGSASRLTILWEIPEQF